MLEHGPGNLLSNPPPNRRAEKKGFYKAWLSPSLSLTSFSSWKLSRGWKEWTWLAGLGVWGGRRQKTPSRFSSNSCLWFVASSQSLGVCVCLLSPHLPGFPLALSLPVSQSLPIFSLTLCLFRLSIFLTPLSVSTSVCPSLPVPVHLSVSPGLSVRGCPCPSVLPPICLC